MVAGSGAVAVRTFFLAVSSLAAAGCAHLAPLSQESWSPPSAPVTAAEEVLPPLPAAPDARYFVGLSGGGAYAFVRHPQVASRELAIEVLALHSGVQVDPRWALSIELSNSSRFVGRENGADRFSVFSSGAGCDKCGPAPTGGTVVRTTLQLTQAVANVELMPWPANGPYAGLGLGAAYAELSGVDQRTGVAASARVGYRLRPARALAASLEGGLRAQLFSDASAYLPYLALQLRPRF